jgi:hypothetical protein
MKITKLSPETARILKSLIDRSIALDGDSQASEQSHSKQKPTKNQALPEA